MAGMTPIFDEDRKEAFLRILAAGDTTIADAARSLGVDPQTPGRHRKTDPDFAHAWDEAVAQRLDLFETEARKRALGGSDRLLIRILEAECPEKYSPRLRTDNRTEIVDDIDETRIGAKLAAILNDTGDQGLDISDFA